MADEMDNSSERQAMRPRGPVARMHAAAASGFTRRKQVAIAAAGWNDWLVVSRLDYVPGDYSMFKAVQATGNHIGAEIYFETSSLQAVRVL